ncbi:MAG: sensor histidine kinase [Clostridiales Family XIII bacterium]|nr:sensor histidine kinase [Clostridiales Family XIII bacterium]
MTLLSKILLLNVVLVGAMLVLSVGLSVRYSGNLLENSLTDNLHNIGQLLATSEDVIAALERGESTPELDKYLDAAIHNENLVDVITLADMRGIRIYHLNKDLVGRHFIGGDESRALAGEHYSSKAYGTLGYQSRYFYPVYGKDGGQVGFVLVSMMMSHLDMLRKDVLSMHLHTLTVVFILGIAASVLLSMSIKRSLLGFEPHQIREGFLQQGDVIDSLDEGLVAVDNTGIVTLANRAAQGILGQEGEVVTGQDIDRLMPTGGMKDFLLQKNDEGSHSLIMDNEGLIVSRVPFQTGKRKRSAGAVAILRDRSEVTRMAEQLTGATHLVEALRANTHEFMNQLHVILGLLQTGGAEEARRYILDVGSIQNETVSAIAERIENPTLAALILGKMNRCGELGVHMDVFGKSCIPAHSRYLSTQSLITVVGNLVENAIEAILAKNGSNSNAREISLAVLESEQGLFLSVEDTGTGMTETATGRLGQNGFTTKGAGRGIGMRLIMDITANAGGEISIESEPDVGTSISIHFPHPRGCAEGVRQQEEGK